MLTRLLDFPTTSFFLFGPRATGKSTWLKHHFHKGPYFDLLRNETFLRLQASPNAFREQVLAFAKREWVVIDEVQRIPSLLQEVHSLIESHGYRFALSGSSARKLKRGQANLLGGRAIVRNLYPLIAAEYGDALSIKEVLSFGTLPFVAVDKENRLARLEAYGGTYLREEIKEEALTRRLDAFSRFLEVAAQMNAQVTSLSNLSRDAMVPRATVTTYFEILTDTLLGSFLPAWKPRARIKEVAHPKFYFFDCGVVRALQGRLHDAPSSDELGHLFETYLFHELTAHISYSQIGGQLSYWRTNDGVEVDFIWQRGAKRIGIEVKSSKSWKPSFEKGILALNRETNAKLKKTFGVYLGAEVLKKDWGWVFPIDIFLRKLAEGEILE
jgi:uncharacterized protein